ncbi:MAG TPA: alpha/beta hydrolase [Candidatus Acidoferrales bacterium]|nr:alpha/beta hydrolase [Candidatus Acidoferrales bacterium]
MSKIALVLLPGLDGTGVLFDDFVANLPPDLQPIVVRYPTDKPLGYAQLEEIVRASIPTNSRFVLLGESFSGPLAISIAASKPAGLIGLVLSCTFARYPRNLFRRGHWLAPYLPVAGMAVIAARRLVSPGRVDPAVAGKLNAAREMVAKRVFRARIGALLRVDATACLSAINVPILDLRAMKDGIVPNRAGDEIRKRGREVRAIDMEGPHFLLQAKPSQAAEVIHKFVSDIAKARGDL